MIVIPMAGNSRRFTEAGYTMPKFMLPLDGQSLFAHSVRSFEAYFASESFLFIARSDMDAGPFIEREVAALGISDARIALLPGPTEGQAQTVEMGLALGEVPEQEPLTIFNIDTFRPNFTYPAKSWFPEADGYLEVMNSTDPGFSFAAPSERGEDRVRETAEKQVISDLASTGLYWFREARLFREIMRDGGVRANGELYIAPMYNAMIAKGLDVRYELVPSKEVIFCGVPQQYEDLLAQA
ncbi:glycosyltransferase family 2 protein [Novosphingobium sp. 1949]|uniref:Glycosyltransferase family 2 protein n=1 Tax=Novosphingobium organovorum TaxID=2930092 RepID=A0ABT0BGY5_9SPHN|nr:glycosyltransferase family 2 protein [Novosphingobium organovorum]MCJ2184185.1 glycosyltransferase family 2 protein [Novosphingobium organovorum]